MPLFDRERWRKRLSKRWVKVVAAALAIGIPASAVAGFKGWEYKTTNPQFCVSCHVMQDAYHKWQESEHKSVTCQTCHRSTIFDNMNQGWVWITKNPQEVGPHTYLDERVCQGCHESKDPNWIQIAETAGHKVHHARARLDCLDCHYPTLHAFKPDIKHCKDCHTRNVKVGIAKMEEMHCLQCHNFLASGKATIRPARAECLACHEKEKVKGGPHHPKIHQDCLQCHRVHMEAFSDPLDCLRCHADLLKKGDHLKDGRLGECIECHTPHEW